jgi:hypothetical protein
MKNEFEYKTTNETSYFLHRKDACIASETGRGVPAAVRLCFLCLAYSNSSHAHVFQVKKGKEFDRERNILRVRIRARTYIYVYVRVNAYVRIRTYNDF